jgi:hypothetical protein
MDERLPAEAQWRCRRKLYRRSDRWGFALVAVAALACFSLRWDPAPIDVQWLATLPNTVGLTMFAGHPMRRLQGFAAPLFSTNPDQPSCGAGQATFVYGMADMKARIGQAMGEPRDCEHPINADGDTVQLTTTGLATYTQRTQTLTFTDAVHAWTLTGGAMSVWALDPQ